MIKRKLIKLICDLRDHVGKPMAVLAYRNINNGYANTIAADTLDDLCDFMAEDRSVHIDEIAPQMCYLFYGIVYRAEDLPYELGGNEDALILLNGAIITIAKSMNQVITIIEGYLKNDFTKSMSSMAVVIGSCKTIAANELLLERARRLRKMYESKLASGGLA